MPVQRRKNTFSDLIISQLNFGLAYAREARSAYDSNRSEYGDLARNIASNAYSAAIRFAARVPNGIDVSISANIEKLQAELNSLPRPRERAIA